MELSKESRNYYSWNSAVSHSFYSGLQMHSVENFYNLHLLYVRDLNFHCLMLKKFSSYFSIISAMERATSPESHMEPQVFIIALASGLIGVALVASFIYFGCFSSARRAHRISQQNGNTANHHGGSSSKSKENSSHKRRSNSVHSSNNHIERYPPKYPSDLFYPLDQSGSNSSSSHYRVRMAECVYCIFIDSYWNEINFGKVGNTVVIEDQNYGRTKQHAYTYKIIEDKLLKARDNFLLPSKLCTVFQI